MIITFDLTPEFMEKLAEAASSCDGHVTHGSVAAMRRVLEDSNQSVDWLALLDENARIAREAFNRILHR